MAAVLALALLGGVGAAAQNMHRGPLTPKSQMGAPKDSIITYMGDRDAVDSLRKHDSRWLGDGRTLERRTREYAKVYGVDVETFRAMPLGKLPQKNPARIPIETVTRGDFHNVLIHENRLALFVTLQDPRAFHLEVINPPDHGEVRLSTTIDYFNWFTAAGAKSKPHSAGERIQEALKERTEVETAEKAAHNAESLRNNGGIDFLLQTVFDQVPKDVVLEFVDWTREPARLSIAFRGSEAAGERFSKAMKTLDIVAQADFKQTDERSFVNLTLNAQALGRRPQVAAYIPLGRNNPFWTASGLAAPNATPVAEPIRVDLDRLALLHIDRGLFGLFARAQVRLPDQRQARVKVGSAVGRYDGRVVQITPESLIVEERYLDPFQKWQVRRTALKAS